MHMLCVPAHFDIRSWNVVRCLKLDTSSRLGKSQLLYMHKLPYADVVTVTVLIILEKRKPVQTSKVKPSKGLHLPFPPCTVLALITRTLTIFQTALLKKKLNKNKNKKNIIRIK